MLACVSPSIWSIGSGHAYNLVIIPLISGSSSDESGGGGGISSLEEIEELDGDLGLF